MAVSKQSVKTVAGPNPYVGGTGASVTFGEFQKVTSAVVACSDSRLLAAVDTAYAYSYSISGNTVKILVYAASTVGAGPNAWGELAAGNLSGIIFTVYAVGE
jgi:hypothetical protein